MEEHEELEESKIMEDEDSSEKIDDQDYDDDPQIEKTIDDVTN